VLKSLSLKEVCSVHPSVTTTKNVNLLFLPLLLILKLVEVETFYFESDRNKYDETSYSVIIAQHIIAQP
jgi:hypothetical protein